MSNLGEMMNNTSKKETTTKFVCAKSRFFILTLWKQKMNIYTEK